MSAEELVDFYNDAGEVTGFGTRSQAEAEHLTYASVIVFVFNSLGKVWLQKRALHKSYYPGLWDPTACGGVIRGELPLQAAQRELAEETGLTTHLHYIETFLNIFPATNTSQPVKRITSVFWGITDDKPAINHEVEALKLFDPITLLDEVAAEPEAFVPCFEIEFTKAYTAYQASRTGMATSVVASPLSD